MSGDYAHLLMRGELVARTEDPDGWRKEMRDEARLDRVKIRTGRSDRDPHVVWALRVREAQLGLDDEDGPALKTLTYQQHIQTTARANGHTFDRWIINRRPSRWPLQRVRRTRYVDTTGVLPSSTAKSSTRPAPACGHRLRPQIVDLANAQAQ